ncbi:MAG: DUF2520 domain-containing protein [Bergeyella zoohelcum]|nr:DUF2520 domain-containing protein [Bergeyella zoohelcum]
MEIIIIGSGNVAYHLAKAFTERQIPIKQVFGRNENALKNLSNELNLPYSTEKLDQADLYLICVSDSAVAEVSNLIKDDKVLVAHTSGSLPKEVLQGNYRKASFYPLQTFSKNKKLNYKDIPFFIEAENNTDTELLKHLAERISSKVTLADYEKRKYIHLTAVFSCNFTNHLFSIAKEIADQQGIPFEYFLPLINETTEKIHQIEPKLAQTGPAVRNDQRILKLHEELITNPLHLRLYQLFNESIFKLYHSERIARNLNINH